MTPTGRVYFADHSTRTTTWDDPRLSSNLDSNPPQYERDYGVQQDEPAKPSLLESEGDNGGGDDPLGAQQEEPAKASLLESEGHNEDCDDLLEVSVRLFLLSK